MVRIDSIENKTISGAYTDDIKESTLKEGGLV